MTENPDKLAVVIEQTLSAIVGWNVRRIRMDAAITQDALARHGRQYGMKWTTARIGELESGKSPITAAHLFVIAHVLAEVTRKKLALGDLLQGTGSVELSPGFSVTVEALQDRVSGKAGEFRIAEIHNGMSRLTERIASNLQTEYQLIMDISPAVWTRTREGAGLADDRAAARLDLDTEAFLVQAAQQWGRSLTEERDSRLGPNDSPQKSGRITRELVDELRRRIGRVDE